MQQVDEQALAADYKAGMRLEDIYAKYGISSNRFYEIIDSLKLPRRGKGLASLMALTEEKYRSYVGQVVNGLEILDMPGRGRKKGNRRIGVIFRVRCVECGREWVDYAYRIVAPYRNNGCVACRLAKKFDDPNEQAYENGAPAKWWHDKLPAIVARIHPKVWCVFPNLDCPINWNCHVCCAECDRLPQGKCLRDACPLAPSVCGCSRERKKFEGAP